MVWFPKKIENLRLRFFCLDLKIIYREIPIIIPGLVFVQKAFLTGLFSGELFFGGGYYRKEFCFSKWVGYGLKQ